jgi:hypothetical protein
MPFANFTVGQVFFAVVHDDLRPPVEAFGRAMELFGEERAALEVYLALLQRCWATEVARRPSFREVRSCFACSLGLCGLQALAAGDEEAGMLQTLAAWCEGGS